jgi:threonine aldolase
MPQHFASDNNAGMCPEAFAALAEANQAGHAGGYGDDPWTVRAHAAMSEVFEHKAKVFFAGNGTAANALVLAQLLKPFDAVIAHALSHIEEDEANAVGLLGGGAKIVTLAAPHAKLTPDLVREAAGRGRGVHSTRARALSLTQSTELGTVYTPGEIGALCDVAHGAGMTVHMDGARFANAVASLGCAPADISWKAGVDVLVFGGVKNGLGFGEAIVFFDEALSEAFAWRVKQAGHLTSKMRFVTAPWTGLLADGVWLKHAAHANAMAARLGKGLMAAGLGLMEQVHANAVFVDMPVRVQETVRAKGWRFYTFSGLTGCRLMCAWDTEPATVDRFLADVMACIDRAH